MEEEQEEEPVFADEDEDMTMMYNEEEAYLEQKDKAK